MTVAKSEVSETIKKWVKQSIWLDLAYDEENPGLGENVTCFPQKDEQQLKDLFGKLVKLRENSLDSIELEMPALPEFKEFTESAEWFAEFLKLKAIRVIDGLRCEHAWGSYADRLAGADSSDSDAESFATLRGPKEEQEKLLDSIATRCIVAIDQLRTPPKDEVTCEDPKQRATLIALFHSEACASARPEFSFGLARSLGNFLRGEPIPSPVREFFALVALHNVARGHNHLSQPLEAMRYIDNRVVDALLCGDERRRKLAERLDQLLGESLLFRALVFPATATLAQALGDLGRHAERRYYLQRALREVGRLPRGVPGTVDGFEYWKCVFEIESTIVDLDVKRPAKPGPIVEALDASCPRLQARLQTAICLRQHPPPEVVRSREMASLLACAINKYAWRAAKGTGGRCESEPGCRAAGW